MLIAPNSVDQSIYFKLQVPVTGAPATGLTIANLNAVYTRDRAAAVTNALTALAQPITAHTDNYGIEVSTANVPGLYRIDFPDAAFAAGVAKVIVGVVGAAIDPAYEEVELAPWLTPITGATVRAVNPADAALGLAGEAATAVETIAGGDGDTLETLSDQLDAVQADLDNPDQYKADVSRLALAGEAAAAVAGIAGGDGDTLETLSDQVDAAAHTGEAATAAAGLASAGALATHDGKLDTLIARVGAFAGAGVNTVMGWMRAMMWKLAPTPSDVGAGFDSIRHSLHALAEAIDAVAGAGTGTSELTINVDDGMAPVDGVRVDLTATNVLTAPVATAYSDAFGQAIFYVDPGTYYVWVQHARYNATNPTMVVVP